MIFASTMERISDTYNELGECYSIIEDYVEKELFECAIKGKTKIWIDKKSLSNYETTDCTIEMLVEKMQIDFGYNIVECADGITICIESRDEYL